MRPIKKSRTCLVVNSPRATPVAGLLAMTPAHCRPIKVIKIPIPAAIEFFKLEGTPFITASLILKRVRIIKITPDIKTIPSALFHETPIPRIIV